MIDITMNEESEPILAGRSDLFFYKPEADKFARIPILTEKEKENPINLTKLCLVPDWGILVGTDRAGLKFYDRHSRKTETVIPDIQVRDIKQCSENTYWIASESGVYILNMADRSITHLQKSLTNEYTISDNAAYSITKDREGGIWVTTFFGGINYLPKEYVPFKYFIGGKTHPGMPGNAVREICPDRYGNLWLGTEDNGINRYNPTTGKITELLPYQPSPPAFGNQYPRPACRRQPVVGRDIQHRNRPSGHPFRENHQTIYPEPIPATCFRQTSYSALQTLRRRNPDRDLEGACPLP